MSNPLSAPLSRRGFFASSGAAALTVGTATTAQALTGEGDADLSYEVTHTEAEWREQLSEFDYLILRDGKTEKPQSSPLWQETAAGSYHCKGCGLKSFSSQWKVVLEKGWVFFYHAEASSVLMGIDGPTPEYGSMANGYEALTEIHCRRCGSHLGHFLIVDGIQTHCINGAALTFEPQAA
ncbi:MAG: peptide-methionine (R)-S-oxide reductase [Litoreibacter sp.]